MSRNKLVSDLFEQEFNKEENYKAIMRRIEEEEKKKQKKPIWKPAIAVLGIVVIVAAAFLLFPKENKQLEEEPQVQETPNQQVDGLYINEVDGIKLNPIDNPWRDTIKKDPDITNSPFTIVDEINNKSFAGEEDMSFGGYDVDNLIEYVIMYNNEVSKRIIFDVTLKDYEPRYLKRTYQQDAIANELVKAKESYIDGQTIKILHFNSSYYINFLKNGLTFDIELKNCLKDDLEKVINAIFR